MLAPKKPKYRKQMKQVRHLHGVEKRGCDISFGDYGLRALEPGWITDREIEASRVAMSRHAKRGGKIWIRIFPDKPLTSKPAEVRMGKGKGAPEKYVAEVRAGRIMFEIAGVNGTLAKESLLLASAKLSVRCKVVERSDFIL